MYGFILVVHVLAAILLIIVILIQRGRGGGLVESFSGVESMFGTRTSQFLTRVTTVFATIFLFTSISQALLAARSSRSLIEEEAIAPLQEGLVDIEPVEVEVPIEESELPAVEAKEVAVEPGSSAVQQESVPEQAVQEENITE